MMTSERDLSPEGRGSVSRDGLPRSTSRLLKESPCILTTRTFGSRALGRVIERTTVIDARDFCAELGLPAFENERQVH